MRKKIQSFNKKLAIYLTLTRPLPRKLRMRWFLDVSKVKESSFFKSDLTDPLRFLMRIFWEIPLYALTAFIFQWVLYQDHVLSQMVLKLIRTNEIREKKNLVYSHQLTFNHIILYKKCTDFFDELAISKRWSAVFCATGAWGGKRIGRVRVNLQAVGSDSGFLCRLKNS